MAHEAPLKGSRSGAPSIPALGYELDQLSRVVVRFRPKAVLRKVGFQAGW